MKTKILIGFSFAIFLSLFIFNNTAEAATTLASVTVEPATDNVDNLMNQASSTWRFTINTNTPLSTSTDAVAITFPELQGTMWNFDKMTASTTWNPDVDWLDFATSTRAITGQRTIVIMASSTQQSTTTAFIIDIKLDANPIGTMTLLKSYNWSVKTCTLLTSGIPSSGCGADIDSAKTAAATLARRGDRVDDWSFTASNYSAGATGVEYTITFTASTTLNIGEKIWVNFPSDFIRTNATTSNQTIAGSATINSTVVDIYPNSWNGLYAVAATTSGAAIAAGATVTLKIGGITNPAAGAYQGLRVFTTTANNGLVDGSFYGDFTTDTGFGNRPPPVNSIQIGGTNTIIGRAKVRQANGTLRDLTAEEIAQVRVEMGCPDKMFSVGTKRLDATGAFTYDHLLTATYVLGVMPDNTSDPTFFATHLQPSRMMVNVTGSETASSSPIFETPDGVIEGTITGGPTGTAGAITTVMVRAYTGSSESYFPMFTDANYGTQGLAANGTGYFKVPVKSGQTWNLSFIVNNANGYLTSSDLSSQYWTPDADPIFVESGKAVVSPAAYAFVVADKTLNVTLKDQSGNTINASGNGPHPCVSINRAGSDMMGPGGQGKCQTTSVGGVDVYQMKVPAGAFSIQVMLPDAGFKEYPVTVLSTDTMVPKTIIIARPTTYITGIVKDPDNFIMQGVSVMAQGSNGGFNQTLTGSDGIYTLYVLPGTYRVEAFAPGYGPLGAKTGVAVTSDSNPTENFTVSAGNTIKGRVYTDADGSTNYNAGDTALEGVQIHAYGTSGENGSQSRNDGTYTLMVPAGNYAVEAWSSTYGFIGVISTVDVSAGNKANQDFIAAGQGTLQITVTGANTYGLTEIFAGAYSTSTGKGNGSSNWIATSTSGADADLVTSFSLPEGYYKIDVGTPGYGNLTSLAANSAASETAITKNATKKLTIALPTMKTLSGTTVANATVWASRTDGPGKYNTTANSTTGAYSINIPTGNTYMVGASLPGYVNTPVTVTNFSANTTQDLTLTVSAHNISGTVSSSAGGTVSEGFVWATKAANTGWVGSEISANGTYSLAVDSGTWTVYANAPCHTSSNGNSQTGSGTVNITLTIQSNCSYQPPQMQSIVPTTGGVVATSSISVNIPANALGTGSSNVSFSVSKPGTVPPATLNAAPISNSVRTISASDSNGTAISTLSNSIEISITYSTNDIPAGSSESDLQLAYWNTTTNTWDPIASTLDTTNHTLTGQVSHLTDFAPIVPTADNAPSTPSGLTAAKNSTTQIDLSWTAVSGATSYLLYRDTSASGSFPYLTTKTSTSHSDTGLTPATTYYYKVTASNANGESAASGAASATTAAISGGGVISGGGGASAPVVPSQVPATTTPTKPTVIAQAPAVSPAAVSVSPIFTTLLKLGSSGTDIKRLQQLLNSDPDTQIAESGIGSPGNETEYFGGLTIKALQKFQAKYGIVSSGSPETTGYGLLGPKTKAKLAEVFAKAAPTAPSVAQPSPIAVSVSPVFSAGLSRGITGADVKRLQQILNSDPDTQIAASGVGSPGNETEYLGSLTEKAIQKFQVKYGIAKEGDPGYGYVGPKTRAKLQEAFKQQ